MKWKKTIHIEDATVPLKTDGIISGTHVCISAGDSEMPFTGIATRCYELGPVSEEHYAIIVQIDSKLMQLDSVRKVYPTGLMLCMDTEVQIISEPDENFSLDSKSHISEDFFRNGWTLTGNLVCSTGQMLYVFEPLSRKKEMSMAVGEDGVAVMLYSLNGKTYSKEVTKIIICGY